MPSQALSAITAKTSVIGRPSAGSSRTRAATPSGLCAPSTTTRGALAISARRPGHRVVARPVRTASTPTGSTSFAAASIASAVRVVALEPPGT
jgi:hypothetical protein